MGEQRAGQTERWTAQQVEQNVNCSIQGVGLGALPTTPPLFLCV